MKKQIGLVIICVLAFAMLACGKKDKSDKEKADKGKKAKIDEATITIVEIAYGESGSSTSKSQEITVKEGDVISYEHATPVEFTVKKINKKHVIIESNCPLSDSKEEKHTINMNSKKTKFNIKKGETLYLNTLTFDSGWKYTITY